MKCKRHRSLGLEQDYFWVSESVPMEVWKKKSKTISYENQLKSNVNLGACLSYHCSSSNENCNFSEIPLKSEEFAPM